METSDLEAVLNLRYRLPASAAQVYKAWTEPNQFRQWFFPTADWRVASAQLDVRSGGSWQAEMRAKDGRRFLIEGVYREVQPNQRLVFTWSSPDEPEYGETVVTLDFVPQADETELRIRHEKFGSKNVRQEHERGWNGCVGHLQQFIVDLVSQPRRPASNG